VNYVNTRRPDPEPKVERVKQPRAGRLWDSHFYHQPLPSVCIAGGLRTCRS